jgi:putative endonuclease
MTEASHISTGRLGEELAVRYLKEKKFRIIERNYRKKWGELDIVAQKDDVLHFIEVKSAACEVFPEMEGVDAHRPEDHMHHHKLARMKRAIETYVLERRVTGVYTADLLVVYVNKEKRVGRVNALWDIEL